MIQATNILCQSGLFVADLILQTRTPIMVSIKDEFKIQLQTL